MDGHQEPLATGLALVEVLALLVDEQDHRLATCPVFRVHLNYGVGGGSSGVGTTLTWSAVQ